MTTANVLVVAVCFTWLGMVLGISFLEAPLKFRAPDVTLRIGLGIGRMVYRALNSIEILCAAAILLGLVFGPHGAAVLIGGIGAAVVLVVQLAVVRPRLTKRSDAVLAGVEGPRSNSHYAYVVLEILKVAALLTLGIAAL